MGRACVRDEIEPGPRIAGEEISRQHVSLEAIAARARKYHVARYVGATVRERMNVVERREVELEPRGAVHAAPPAVAHGGTLDRSLLVA